MKKLILAVLLIAITSCSKQDSGTGVTGTQDYAGKQFPITVHVYDTEREMQQAIKDLNPPEGYYVEGFSLWTLRKDTMEMTKCDLHVVKPKSVRDHSQMTTWGHELVHCVYGTYHQNGER